MTVLSLLALGQEDVVLMSGFRQVAEPWTQSVRAVCGRDVLEVMGYGAGTPQPREPRIRVNGRALTGDAVPELLGDISTASAVYRFQVMCPRNGGFSVIVSRGEVPRDGGVVYENAAARITGRELVTYSGMGQATAEDFWFR
ncbi:hypothetical protein [Brevundimonas sp.]|uniref:hypothetical protein n=1 Tax=Brevundimonas sp. TaxID=1871086 RepID=UPI003F6EA417